MNASRSIPRRRVVGGLLLVALCAGEAQAVDGLMDKAQDMVRDTWSGVTRVAGNGDALPTDINPGGDPGPPETFVEVWEQLLPRLDETLKLDEEASTLPNSALFGRDRGDVQGEIDQLLDEAIGILGISDAQQYRQHIRELQQAIAAKRAKITEFRQLRITAPRESVWQNTAADYAEKISELEKDIKAHEQEMGRIRAEFAAHLQSIGLNLSSEQLEFLLSTVVGEDIVQMGIAFDNVKLMTVQLEKLLAESREEISSARRYYGMYTVLLRVLDRLYGDLVQRIEQEYLPGIEGIVERTTKLQRETQELLGQYPEQGEILRSNLASQALTLKAARLYQGYLREQHQDVVSARARLADDMRIANNTFDTVKVSGELLAIVRNSRHLLETLGRMQVPALRGFENLEMKREFERLTNEMQQGQINE